MIDSVVMLTPEPPYPLRSGGAFRIASLLHYFARFAAVDLIFLSDSGEPAELPPGLVRNQTVIALPVHGRGVLARYLRNARRALRGVPPLVDRVSGLEDEVARALSGKHYDAGIVEHFWPAGYFPQLSAACDQVILDLHNIESTLHARCAATTSGLVALGHSRFARSSRRLEAELLPGYSLVLTTSDHDRAAARQIAPGTAIAVYPNAYPDTALEHIDPYPDTVVFSGNFEYHPNIDGVVWLMGEIWPKIVRLNTNATLVLVGRGTEFIRSYIEGVPNVRVTGPVDDALAEIARGSVVIAPLRSGSGTRVKILEAWAAGRPVVSTSLAAEGLGAVNARDIAIVDDPAGFAESVCGLLSNPSEQARLAAGGKHILHKKYTWEAAWETLDSDPQVTRFRELSSYTG